ncbi:metallophosphoesterase family protein [Pelagibacterium sp. H642]|uniref:metallophosphoesterase family protein n=1 Tax=Pelagibacterium sp. H642 TaxID=1881069 RepID=UPI0028164875|nr:metallophosphoesterase family protein [Pelagibacterium sp. H642]WMT89700.1 metallophosphatase family protein [Pelagibacterium sp. H642]
MRVAVISDVHGNALALEAVLADIARHEVDKILNLGDHFAGPLEPVKVAAMLSELDMVAIRGNTDRYLLDADPKYLDEHDKATLRSLAGDAMDWLGSLPETEVFEDAIFLSHGSPNSDETYWLDRKDKKTGFRAATHEEIEAELSAERLPVYCCGHTHVARVVTLGDGTIVFNPGSVGRPSFTMGDPESAGRVSPAAAYAIVETSAGKWHVNLRQVAYDNMAAAAIARAHGSEKWARDLEHGRQR